MLQWVAHYNDDTELCQYDDRQIDPTHRGRSYEQIDKSKLELFEVMDAMGNVVCEVPVPEGANFIFRKKRRGKLAIGMTEGQVSSVEKTEYENEEVIFFIGVQEKLRCSRCQRLESDCTHLENRKNSFFAAVFPDGHMRVFGKKQKDDALLWMKPGDLVAADKGFEFEDTP